MGDLRCFRLRTRYAFRALRLSAIVFWIVLGKLDMRFIDGLLFICNIHIIPGMKPTIFAIAIVLPNPEDVKQILGVLRPETDRELPNIWGLPAGAAKEGEMPEETVRRIGIEKLDTEIEPVSQVGIKSHDRDTYELILMVIRVKLIGDRPSVASAKTNGTKYVAQKWVTDYSIFVHGAKMGSICDRIFLESQEICWE